MIHRTGVQFYFCTSGFLLARRGRCGLRSAVPAMVKTEPRCTRHGTGAQIIIKQKAKITRKIKHNNKTTNKRCCTSAALPPPSLAARLGSPSCSVCSLAYTIIGVCPTVSPLSLCFFSRRDLFLFFSPPVLSLSLAQPALSAHPARLKGQTRGNNRALYYRASNSMNARLPATQRGGKRTHPLPHLSVSPP